MNQTPRSTPLGFDAFFLATKALKTAQGAAVFLTVTDPDTDLQLLQASDGQEAYATSRRCYCTFVEDSTATVDNVWFFTAFGGVGRWHRHTDTFNAWSTTAVWDVNPSTGDNNNDGTTAPLASMAELAARINGSVLTGAANLVTINVTGTLDAAKIRTVVATGVSMVIHGIRTTGATGTVTASNAATPATNTPARITDAGVVTWTTGVLIQSPPLTGNLAWIDRDLTGGQARTSTVMTPLGNATGALGGTYAPVTLPTMPNADILVQCELSTSPASSQQLHIEGINFTRAGGNDFDLSIVAECRVRLSECKADAPLSIQGQATSSTGAAVLISNTWITEGYTAFPCKGNHVFQGGVLRATSGTALTVSPGTSVAVQNAQVLCTTSATGFFVATGAVCSLSNAGIGCFNNSSDASVFRPGSALLVSGSTAGIVWGDTNTGMGMRLNANAHADYVAAQIHTVTGTAGDFRCGNSALALTTIDTSVSPTTTITGNQTWANVTAAFGGTILNPLTGATLTPV